MTMLVILFKFHAACATTEKTTLGKSSGDRAPGRAREGESWVSPARQRWDGIEQNRKSPEGGTPVSPLKGLFLFLDPEPSADALGSNKCRRCAA